MAIAWLLRKNVSMQCLRPPPANPRLDILSLLFLGAVLLSLGVASRLDAAETKNSYFYQSWQTEDGLPDNVVKSIAQTPDGYLWLSTPRGLVRFDGFQFTTFTPHNLPGLANSQIHKLFVDRGGTLWLGAGTSNLNYLRDGKCFRFNRDGITLDPLRAICQDSQGTIWVSPWGDLLCKLVGDKALALTRAGGSPVTNTIFCDTSGGVWTAYGSSLARVAGDHIEQRLKTEEPLWAAPRSAGGLWVMTGSELHCYLNDQLGPKLAEIPVPSTASAIFEDRDGGVWVGAMTQGLWRYSGGHFERVPTSHDHILCIFQDREGNMWVGTEGGGLDRIARAVFSIGDRKTGLPDDVFVSVCEGADGAILCTTRAGSLLSMSAGGDPIILSDASDFPRTEWTTVNPARDGSLWVASVGSGVLRIQGESKTLYSVKDPVHWIPNDRVTAMHEDGSGRLWIISEDGLARLNGERFQPLAVPELKRADLRCLASDSGGGLWLGAGEGTVYRWSGKEWTILGPKDGLPGDPLRCILPMENGDVWVATYGGGLACFHAGHFVACTSRHGLWDDAVTEMLLDNGGRVWCGTPRGLFTIAVAGLAAFATGKTSGVECVAFGRSDGIPIIRCAHEYQPRCWKKQDGRLLFATYNGLAVVDPAHLQTNPLPPPVRIVSLATDGTAAPATDFAAPVAIGPAAKEIEFTYTTLSFTAPDKIRFRHRIQGLDTAWSAPTADRRATYYGIPPGDYRFQVIASNNDGVWNQMGATAAFSVAAPFWQKWWFRLGMLGAFTGAVVLIVRSVSFLRLRTKLRLAQQRAVVEGERARIARDMHDELGSALSRIALLGDLAEDGEHPPAQVRNQISKMTSAARQAVSALDEIVWAVNPRNDKLARLIEYTARYAAEFLEVAGIRCQMDLPVSLPEGFLSSEVRHHIFLAIKEALHNVVKHAGATEVQFTWSSTEKGSVIVIADNGCGFNRGADDGCSDGLRNMEARMSAVGGSCEIQARSGTGAVIRFHLP